MTILRLALLVFTLILFGVWVAWHEGGGVKAWFFGILCVTWGGMFTFPYLLLAITKTCGEMSALFLRAHSDLGAVGLR